MVQSTASQTGEVLYVFLALLGAVIAGFGSAILIMTLGELFSLFSVTVAGLSFAGSVTIGTLLFFGVLKLPIHTAFLVTALCPLIAVLFIILGSRQLSKTNSNVIETTTSSSADTSGFPFPFPRRLVLLIVLFYLAGGFFHKMIILSSVSSLQESYWLTNLIYCLVIIIAGSCLSLFSNLDLSILYRPVLPLLGSGFVLIPFFHELSVLLPLTLLQAGFALFDLYTWLLFTYIAKFSQRPAYVFGWGMFLITISIFVGETLFATLFAKISFSMDEIEILSLCAALLMLAGTMLFQGKRDSYAGWESPQNPLSSANYLGQNLPEQTSITQIASTGASELALESVELKGLEETGETGALEGQGEMAQQKLEDIREQFFLSLELTRREKDVTLLLFEGRNNPYIRGDLNISNNTLKTHLKNIYRKALVNDRQQLLDLFLSMQGRENS